MKIIRRLVEKNKIGRDNYEYIFYPSVVVVPPLF